MNSTQEHHSESGTLIFVYGTLKRGFSRSSYLENQIFLGEAITAPHYCMYDCGEYPGIVLDREAGGQLQGELWRVDLPGVQILDAVEGVAQNLFSRNEIELVSPIGIETAQAYYYRRNVSLLTKCDGLWTKGFEK